MHAPRLAGLAGCAAVLFAWVLVPPATAATYAVGPGGDFATLTSALATSFSEATVLELTPGYTSAGETFPIALFGAQPVTVRPRADASGLVISAPTTPVQLGFGASFVFDGRPGGVGTSRQLTIRCTATIGSTVAFVEASHDTLRFVNVESANTSATSGAILFAPNQLGCAFDAVQSCRIGGGGLVPTHLIYLNAGNVSSQIQDLAIEDCELLDWFADVTTTAAVLVQSGNSKLSFRRNSFYQTATRTFSASGRTQYAMLVNGTPADLSIEDNWFGGSAPACGGAPWTLRGAGALTMLVAGTDNAAPATVRGNVIRNLDVVGAGTLRLVSMSGRTRFLDNLVGGDVPSQKIVLQSPTSQTSLVSIGSADQSEVRGNRIAGVTLSATIGGLRCLSVSTSLPAVTVVGNVIGGSSGGAIVSSGSGACTGLLLGGAATSTCRADSNEVSFLSRTSASSGFPLFGISVTNLSVTMARNVVHDLADAASTTLPAGSITLSGLDVSQTAPGLVRVERSVVHSLAAGTAGPTRVYGIRVGAADASTVGLDANFVHSLTSASTDTTSRLIGVGALLFGGTGAATVTNQMVRAGIGPSGQDAVLAARCIGAYSEGPVQWIGNSIFVGGVTGDPSTSSSIALEISSLVPGPKLRNNVLVNARGGFAPGGRHAALQLGSFPLSGFTSDRNLFWAPVGAGSGVLVQAGSLVYGSLPAWQVQGHDHSSLVGDPQFVAPYGTSSSVDLHVVTAGLLAPPGADAGVVWLGWNADFDGETRDAVAPDIGADEFDWRDLTGVESAPPVLALAPARPNPSHGATTFEFALPRADRVTLMVFDAAGRRVCTLADGARAAGLHAVRWNADDDAGRALAPGAYVVRLATASGLRATRRVVLLR
ncbi:MAG: FlgD immunoglobulin-like domain containing protein [Candidatus Eisenbacteria bacterium]